MKISVLTASFNRQDKLPKLYSSLLKNHKNHPEVELDWLIMDDGSTDDTKTVVERFIFEKEINIYYYYQENQGKMSAINNLMKYAKSDIIIECDSDDFFLDNAFEILKDYELKLLKDESIYALVFQRDMGDKLTLSKEHKTTMFDLYFKEGYIGETTIVYNGKIRQQYSYKIEENEKFVTESRMYHEMDKKYKVLFIPKCIVDGEIYDDGYTKKANSLITNYPKGFYNYFLEIFFMDWKGVSLKKKIYVYKHYILCSYLASKKNAIRKVKGIKHKIVLLILWPFGIALSKKRFKRK